VQAPVRGRGRFEGEFSAPLPLAQDADTKTVADNVCTRSDIAVNRALNAVVSLDTRSLGTNTRQGAANSSLQPHEAGSLMGLCFVY
jgi:hypothetical protein